MTQRWDHAEYEAWNSWLHEKHRHPLVVSPVAMVYRQDQMLSVYPYDGASLLIDSPGPIGRRRLYSMALELAHVLQFIHSTGARLGDFSAANVLVMPDNSVRVFDLNIIENMHPRVLMTHSEDPVRVDASRLARLLLQFISPVDSHIRSFLWDAVHERYQSPMALIEDLKRQLVRTVPTRWAPKAAVLSDVGIVRERHEDRWLWYAIDESSCLVICADGMGGYMDGGLAAEVASRAVAASVIDYKGKSPDWAKLMLAGMETANAELYKTRKSSNSDLAMATTIVAMVIEPDRLTVVHAGDSRAYLVRDKTLVQLTNDHSLIAELLASGRITKEQAKTHPSRNIVTSGLGLESEFDHDTRVEKLSGGERILLCSDGLASFVENDELRAALLYNETPAEAVISLTRRALAGGSTDNITTLVCDNH
jgi:protein phosphatase